MLKQRIITALVLTAIALPILLLPQPQWFILLSMLMMCAAVWEWFLLNGQTRQDALWAAIGFGLVCFISWLAFEWTDVLWAPTLVVCAILWLVGGAFLLYKGVGYWQQIPTKVRLALGLGLFFISWWAIAQARLVGVNFLLSVFAIVWAADISAYTVGRALGGRLIKRKLAAAISPGKSWEGALGGLLGVLLLAAVWLAADKFIEFESISIYTRLAQVGWWYLLLSLVLLVTVSVMGDLLESLVKRSAGVKDSSALLPGHGGVLDRFDAILPTVVWAILLVYFS